MFDIPNFDIFNVIDYKIYIRSFFKIYDQTTSKFYIWINLNFMSKFRD